MGVQHDQRGEGSPWPSVGGRAKAKETCRKVKLGNWKVTEEEEGEGHADTAASVKAQNPGPFLWEGKRKRS